MTGFGAAALGVDVASNPPPPFPSRADPVVVTLKFGSSVVWPFKTHILEHILPLTPCYFHVLYLAKHPSCLGVSFESDRQQQKAQQQVFDTLLLY